MTKITSSLPFIQGHELIEPCGKCNGSGEYSRYPVCYVSSEDFTTLNETDKRRKQTYGVWAENFGGLSWLRRQDPDRSNLHEGIAWTSALLAFSVTWGFLFPFAEKLSGLNVLIGSLLIGLVAMVLAKVFLAPGIIRTINAAYIANWQARRSMENEFLAEGLSRAGIYLSGDSNLKRIFFFEGQKKLPFLPRDTVVIAPRPEY